MNACAELVSWLAMSLPEEGGVGAVSGYEYSSASLDKSALSVG